MVFLSPSEQGFFVVKRVIGIPGDRIHLREGVVYRNGKKVEELYIAIKDGPSSSTRVPTAKISRGSRRKFQRHARLASRTPEVFEAKTCGTVRTTTSPWATTAMSAMTAVSGDSFRRRT